MPFPHVCDGLMYVKALSESPDLQSHDERDIDKVNFVKLKRSVHVRKGKWQRFSDEQIQRMRSQLFLGLGKLSWAAKCRFGCQIFV